MKGENHFVLCTCVGMNPLVCMRVALYDRGWRTGGIFESNTKTEPNLVIGKTYCAVFLSVSLMSSALLLAERSGDNKNGRLLFVTLGFHDNKRKTDVSVKMEGR